MKNWKRKNAGFRFNDVRDVRYCKEDIEWLANRYLLEFTDTVNKNTFIIYPPFSYAEDIKLGMEDSLDIIVKNCRYICDGAKYRVTVDINLESNYINIFVYLGHGYHNSSIRVSKRYPLFPENFAEKWYNIYLESIEE